MNELHEENPRQPKRKRQVLGTFTHAGEKLFLWVVWGPELSCRSSSAGPDGVWRENPRPLLDLGPSLVWGKEFSDTGINGVHLDQLLEPAVKSGELRIAPMFNDEAVLAILSAEDKQRFAQLALDFLPAMDGRFEVRWVPNDPSVPF